MERFSKTQSRYKLQVVIEKDVKPVTYYSSLIDDEKEKKKMKAGDEDANHFVLFSMKKMLEKTFGNNYKIAFFRSNTNAGYADQQIASITPENGIRFGAAASRQTSVFYDRIRSAFKMTVTANEKVQTFYSALYDGADIRKAAIGLRDRIIRKHFRGSATAEIAVNDDSDTVVATINEKGNITFINNLKT